MLRKHRAEPEGLNADVEQVTQALAKIRDPFARYFVAMFVDIIADRIAEMPATTASGLGLPQKMPRMRRASAALTAGVPKVRATA